MKTTVSTMVIDFLEDGQALSPVNKVIGEKQSKVFESLQRKLCPMVFAELMELETLYGEAQRIAVTEAYRQGVLDGNKVELVEYEEPMEDLVQPVSYNLILQNYLASKEA